MRVAAVQQAPVFGNTPRTLDAVVAAIEAAGKEDLDLIAFGETFVPGYPFWLSRTNGATFEDADQKSAYAQYLEAAVESDGPALEWIRQCAGDHDVAVVLGFAERVRGSVHASLCIVGNDGSQSPVHRKLVPTYEERLVWAPGDGHGLCAHRVRGRVVTALNCWENWMPLPRFACYAQGSELHVALWPGGRQNTEDITRHVAREGRCFVLSASAVLQASDIPEDFALRDKALAGAEADVWLHDGGSAIASPTGRWLVEPQAKLRGFVEAELDFEEVARERQNFDPAGHYHRPDVFELGVDRTRRTPATFRDV